MIAHLKQAVRDWWEDRWWVKQQIVLPPARAAVKRSDRQAMRTARVLRAARETLKAYQEPEVSDVHSRRLGGQH